MMILMRIRRCRFCRRELTRHGLSLAENPYCPECLAQRVSGLGLGPVAWKFEGEYAVPSWPTAEKSR